MTLNDFYNEVSRTTDTVGTKINVADTRRVLSEAFKLLSTMNAAESTDLVAKGIAAGAKNSAKKPAKKRATKKRAAKKKK